VLGVIIASEQHVHPASVRLNMSGGVCRDSEKDEGGGDDVEQVQRVRESEQFICFS
jgi:hypothetical protein